MDEIFSMERIVKRTGIWLSAVALFSSSAMAGDFPEEYTLYCKGDRSTGLNWSKDRWEETRFYPKDHIVAKWKTNSCLEFVTKPPKRSVVSNEVCVNIREPGQEYRPALSGKCTEFVAPQGASWSNFLVCDGLFTGYFVTRIDGWFHRSSMHSQLDAFKDDKDSLVVEVGKCSQIK